MYTELYIETGLIIYLKPRLLLGTPPLYGINQHLANPNYKSLHSTRHKL